MKASMFSSKCVNNSQPFKESKIHFTSRFILFALYFENKQNNNLLPRCAACSKCFLNSNKLKYHIRRSHLPVEGSFDCTICERECKTLRLLLNHQKSHIKIDCPHCLKQISAANYDHHIRTAHVNPLPKKRKIKNEVEKANKKQTYEQRQGTSESSNQSNRRLNRKDAPARVCDPQTERKNAIETTKTRFIQEG